MQEGQVGMITSELDELFLAPTLIIDTEDHRLLTRLALAGISEASTVADDLLYELSTGRASFRPNSCLWMRFAWDRLFDIVLRTTKSEKSLSLFRTKPAFLMTACQS
jgi:hypothetical protein